MFTTIEYWTSILVLYTISPSTHKRINPKNFATYYTVIIQIYSTVYWFVLKRIAWGFRIMLRIIEAHHKCLITPMYELMVIDIVPAAGMHLLLKFKQITCVFNVMFCTKHDIKYRALWMHHLNYMCICYSK